MNIRPFIPLEYFHPNARGTGSAMQVHLRPANNNGVGGIDISIAPQNAVAKNVDGKFILPSFDWRNVLEIRVPIAYVARIIYYLRNKEGDVFVFDSVNNTSLHIAKDEVTDNFTCFSVKKDDLRFRILLDESEAYTLLVVLEHSLLLMAFGLPLVD